MPRTLPIGLAATLLLLAAGGCTFDRNWRQLARAPAHTLNAGVDPLAGRWEGKWVSAANGHSGRLRAIITPVDESNYRVDYDATYLSVLRFGYGMNLTATRQPDGRAIAFEGREDLGALAGGVYRYEGAADGTSFNSTYESKADHGRFQMTRPAR